MVKKTKQKIKQTPITLKFHCETVNMLLSIAKPRLERVVRTRQDPCADERAPDVASNTIALMGGAS